MAEKVTRDRGQRQDDRADEAERRVQPGQAAGDNRQMKDDSATKADENDRGELRIGDMALVEKRETPMAAPLKRPGCQAGGNEKGRDRGPRLNQLVRVVGCRLTAQQRDRVIDKKQSRYDGQ